nr:septum formation family protein [Nocardioides perillae]
MLALAAVAAVAAVVLGAIALSGGGAGTDAPDGGSAGSGASPSGASPEAGDAGAAGSAATGDAPVAPRPATGACYALTYAEAVAATTEAAPVACRGDHTARTVAVGALPLVVDGHLLAVDSARARAAPAQRCPDRVADFLGGSRDDLRLSMLRAVWFSPTLAQADRGADWFRCDVVALAGDEQLAPLEGRLAGVLARPAGAAYAVCGTAEPGTAGFERVVCSRPHRWRAVSVVELDGRRYPGEAAVREAGQAPCEAAGRAEAADPLDFRWGWEWPTRAQWEAGTTWGLCWVPDPA